VSSTGPVALYAASTGGEATLPGAETLGLDVVVPRAAFLVARDDATVTTELDGVPVLAAGRGVALGGGQRVSSTAPVLVVDGAVGRTAVAPVEQWLSSGFAAWPGGGDATVIAVAAAPLIVSGTLVLRQSGSFASSSDSVATPFALAAASPFFALVGAGNLTLPAGYGLAQIH
jgi:hypothetical protein